MTQKVCAILNTLNKIRLGNILIDWNEYEVTFVKYQCKIYSEVSKVNYTFSFGEGKLRAFNSK